MADALKRFFRLFKLSVTLALLSYVFSIIPLVYYSNLKPQQMYQVEAFLNFPRNQRDQNENLLYL